MEFPPHIARLIELIEQARSPFPDADLTAVECRWCGNGRHLDSFGSVRCVHCDVPHVSALCGICLALLSNG